ncbi:sigma factor [Pseudomonas sp. NPDC088322]|uniref:sigma factor n=1 Tax=Pseudomonas sp. NPDC088322 TaxID=3364452 RepID=UPI00381E5DF6
MGSASSRDLSAHGDIHGLYVEHHAWLKRWLWQRMGCRSDAADLTQDTFLRLLRPAHPTCASRVLTWPLLRAV